MVQVWNNGDVLYAGSLNDSVTSPVNINQNTLIQSTVGSAGIISTLINASSDNSSFTYVDGQKNNVGGVVYPCGVGSQLTSSLSFIASGVFHTGQLVTRNDSYLNRYVPYSKATTTVSGQFWGGTGSIYDKLDGGSLGTGLWTLAITGSNASSFLSGIAFSGTGSYGFSLTGSDFSSLGSLVLTTTGHSNQWNIWNGATYSGGNTISMIKHQIVSGTEVIDLGSTIGGVSTQYTNLHQRVYASGIGSPYTIYYSSYNMDGDPSPSGVFAMSTDKFKFRIIVKLGST